MTHVTTTPRQTSHLTEYGLPLLLISDVLQSSILHFGRVEFGNTCESRGCTGINISEVFFFRSWGHNATY